jgi:excisionase family DNA binding protein
MTAPSTPQRVLLTPAEAADRLSIGRTKLYELMAAGLIRSVCIDRCRRIPVSALNEYVEHLLRDQLSNLSP